MKIHFYTLIIDANFIDYWIHSHSNTNLLLSKTFSRTSIEVLESGQYTKANDVWSFAVTMWEIFSYGARPWEQLSMQHVSY